MKKLMFVGCLLAGCLGADAASLKSGESVAFLGDSITQQGWGHSSGYVRLCEAAFKANGLDVKIFPAGISGNRSTQMLARLERHVLSKKPTYMTLSCGVNDVWHGKNGVPLEQYKENITKLVEKAQSAGVKVIILTATMIGEDAQNANNKKLVAYNDFLRSLAKEKGMPLVDLNAEMQRQVTALTAAGYKGNNLTSDGVHMDFLGDRMMATMILKDGFNFTKKELATSEEAFKKIPYKKNIRIHVEVKMTGEDYLRLTEAAHKEKLTTTTYIESQIKPAADKKAAELSK